MDLPSGYILQNGKYRIAEVIGQGGFGITYKGVWFTEVKGPLGTVKTEVPICIKEYFFNDYCYREAGSLLVKVHSDTGKVLFDKFKERLIKEAKILSEVHHPHIVNVLEVFEENNTAYIAMEYIPGCSLKYLLDKEGVLPENRVLHYVHQIGEALEFVHKKNILHLDIKPSNILVDPDDDVHLIDFGVSKRYDIENQETSTTTLTLSKGFASIEQYDNEGTHNFSPCPDIYSLGATMYNLLTGKIPTESILRATHPLKNPAAINPAITSKTEAAIIKAMQIIPEDRFQSVPEMMASLDFPPEKLLKNPYRTTSRDDDKTQVLSQGNHYSLEEDKTIIDHQNDSNPQRKKKKHNKFTLVVALIIILLFICTGIYFILPESRINEGSLSDEMRRAGSDSSIVKNQQSLSTVQPEVGAPAVMDTTSVTNDPKKVDTTENLQDNTTKQNFAALIASGKAKMEAENYNEARRDFDKASELAKGNQTKEVVSLILQCEQKNADKMLNDRRGLYEYKKSFGKLELVRRISTKYYGAVDANAKEIIPCMYLNMSPADNNCYAFWRKDNLYDIYNSEGTLVDKATASY